ncbi:MAG: hypothetical protein B5766_13005 [Candidatus Lumbricidophila eiseniae]|uniref:Methyltransferase domain-containing protein n=1 Tax=Candidatus Lumbricidiphila eiseniae TaxID=1969409 RepID=A0A2A6FMN5_9MICO|nr:MAG: hypothetical protein B5766_13005 [Candidatus Lumbricidophila eiseniae]
MTMDVDQSARAWWASFFADDLYPESDLEFLDPALTAEMVAAVRSLIPAGRLVDLACGLGRHSIPLSRAGYTVTGVDLSDGYLSRARDAANEAGQSIRFIKSDMRDLSVLFDSSVDAVISLHTSLGFFETSAENSRVLQEAARVLTPGGLLLVDVMNRDWFLRQTSEVFAVETGDYVIRNYDDSRPAVYLHEERFDPLTSRIQWTVKEVGSAGRRSSADYRVYSVHEIVEQCHQLGLNVEAVCGGYDLSPFTVFAEHIICLARKS